MGRHDVFFAADNVWGINLEEAKRVLQGGFIVNSKILMTCQSEQVLKDFLMVRVHVKNAKVAPLLAPERKEGFQIFQEALSHMTLASWRTVIRWTKS